MMMNGIHHKRTWLSCKENYGLALSILASSINDTDMLLIHPVAQFAVADHFPIQRLARQIHERDFRLAILRLDVGLQCVWLPPPSRAPAKYEPLQSQLCRCFRRAQSLAREETWRRSAACDWGNRWRRRRVLRPRPAMTAARTLARAGSQRGAVPGSLPRTGRADAEA